MPLTKAAVDALAAHLEPFPAPAVKIGNRKAPGNRAARLIFPNRYRETGKAEGSEPARVQAPYGASPHDLRYFYASAMCPHGALLSCLATSVQVRPVDQR